MEYSVFENTLSYHFAGAILTSKPCWFKIHTVPFKAIEGHHPKIVKVG